VTGDGSSPNGVVDITILGAGPTGLAAAYYAGHRDVSVRIVESLEQLGGQVAAMYPEKHVYDVAGHPKILGQALVDLCAEQGLQYGADVRLGEEVRTLDRVDQDGEELLAVSTDEGNRFLSRALIVTAGHGAFEPRKLGVEGIDEWEGRGLHYFVRKKDTFRDRSCVIVGGGDSALDWTLGLQDTARLPITLVHRRDRFRALEASVNEARALEGQGRVAIMTSCEVREVHGDGSIEAVTIENTTTGEATRVDCEALITLLGFHSHLGAISDWGLELEGKRQVKVNPMTMETNLPRVFAAGDVAGYPGKITLITVGMGEAAIAANNAIAQIRGEKVQPKYSTD
jgi:ferredoxin/flavodoxin---NADP+ reductase